MWTRRAMIKAGGLALFSASLGGTPLFLGRAAGAISHRKGRRRVLVALFQRGAMDGLMAVPPFTDPHLKAMRPRLAMSVGKEGLVDLDGRFGLHPALAPLLPLYRSGDLAIVHGVGSPAVTRSHFDAQDYMESGTPGVKNTRSGWLNRAVGMLGHEPTPLQAVAMSEMLPRSLQGEAPAIAIDDLDTFGLNLPAWRSGSGQAERIFEALYTSQAPRLMEAVGSEGFEAMHLLQSLDAESEAPTGGARYPRSPLGNHLKQIARLIRADVGLEIAFAEAGGWDTHVQQGTTAGVFARRADDLAQAIAAFWTDLGAHRDDVALMTMTEFGRTVHENGSGGTDHGRASCLFVLGGRVKGGKVYGRVPELALDALEDRRDLPVTTDFRAVFADVAGRHLNIKDDRILFPGWTGTRFPMMA